MENTKALEVAQSAEATEGKMRGYYMLWNSSERWPHTPKLPHQMALEALTNYRDEATASYATKLAAEQAMCDRLAEALVNARLQVVYLHDKFKETGSGNGVLTQTEAVLTSYTAHKEGR